MDCCSHCDCAADGPVMDALSRRKVLAAMTAAAVAVPLLGRAAAAEDAPAAGDPQWLKTVKASDLAAKASLPIVGHPIILTRDNKTILALSSKCTHKGCTVKSAPANAPTLDCPCHGAKFDLTGKNLNGPHNSPATLKPLFHYPVRLSADGYIEVDTSRHVTPDDPAGSATLPA